MTAAARLMHERGYTAVGVGEICRQANVNKGSFYHFFPSKSALAIAVVDRHWRDASKALHAALTPDAPALERLDRLCRAYHDDCARALAEGQPALGCPFGILALEVATQDQELRTHLAGVFDRLAVVLAGVVADGIREGTIPAQETDAAARGILALIEGRQMQARVAGSASPLAALPVDVRRMLDAPVDRIRPAS